MKKRVASPRGCPKNARSSVMPCKPEGASSCVSVAACGCEKTSLFAMSGSVGGCGEARGHEQFRWLCPTSRLLLLPAHGGQRLLDARRKMSLRLLFQRRHEARRRRDPQRVLDADAMPLPA